MIKALRQHATLLLDINSANKTACSVTVANDMVKYTMTNGVCVNFSTQNNIALKPTIDVNMIGTRKSLQLVVDAAQHRFAIER